VLLLLLPSYLDRQQLSLLRSIQLECREACPVLCSFPHEECCVAVVVVVPLLLLLLLP
jgi:hypothetical protein